MCGILAVYSPSGGVNEDIILEGLEPLRHRGPERRGVWLAPDASVGLGHARLSIIDLDTGDQPIHNEDNSRHIVVNGEFYDYERLQRSLMGAGHTLATKSDSEVALHLYEDLGTQCLHQLRGEFAFVIWDGQNDVLFAARDRFGIKPLYYTYHQDRLYLASEAKALFAVGIPAKWDLDSVYQQCFVELSDDSSLFANIRQVPPGHFLIAKRNYHRIVKYWDFDYPRRKPGDELPDPDSYIPELSETLFESVRLRLRADVPVGVYLSGGLDSTAILAIAAQYVTKPLQAFTVAFRDENFKTGTVFDESSIAEESAKAVATDHHILEVTPDTLADNFSAALYHSEVLHGNGNGVAKFCLSKLVQDHGLKVVLTGDGADESFLGYKWFAIDYLRHDLGYEPGLQHPRVPTELLEWVLQDFPGQDNERWAALLQLDQAMSATGQLRRALGWVPYWYVMTAIHARIFSSVLSDEMNSRYGRSDAYRNYLDRIDGRSQLKGRSHARQASYLWSKSTYCNQDLNYLADRMEMAHSVEGRTPFLDHVLFERLRELPVEVLYRDGREKSLLRELTKSVLPPHILERRKWPFISPILYEVGRFKTLVQDTLRSASVQDVPFLDQKRVLALLDGEHAATAALHAPYHSWFRGEVLLRLTSAVLLQQRFKVS